MNQSIKALRFNNAVSETTILDTHLIQKSKYFAPFLAIILKLKTW